VSSDRIRAPREVGSTNASREDGTRRAILTKAGLAAGAVGLLAAQGSARAQATRFDDTVEVVPPSGVAALRLVCSGSVSASASAGGALNLDNSASSGAGAVLYSNRGADAIGRLLLVNQASPANPQHAVRIQNAGTAHTVSILHDPGGGAGDPTAEALDIVSTNVLDTALGVRGRESGKGTVKITHAKPDGSDANASALSIALEGAGTACQGIFIGNDAGNPTTGDLLHIRNGGRGTERLTLTADGRLELPAQGPAGGIVIGGDVSVYRSAPHVLATDATAQAGALRLTPVDRAVTDDRYLAAEVPPETTITLNSGGGLRGVAVRASIATNGALDPTSLLMFDASSVVTPAAPTNMHAVEIYKSCPAVNGLPGVVKGIAGSIFSSFQHRLRLRPIPADGSGSFTSVFGFYAPPAASVDAGWTVTNYSVLRVEAPSGAGTILNLTGLDIRDFRERAANNYSMRSFGTGVHMRHSGGVGLGAQATPDTILHLRGNERFHGSVTVDQEAGDPPPPAAARQARLYVKNGKLVVQWNDGGKTLFTTVPLDAPGPYPVATPITTDTVAP
jgi:hypothetical protein